MWNVLHHYKILITLYCWRPFFFMSHWCVIFFLSPASGLSSRLIYILSRRIRTSSWVWALQAAAAVQPTERKSQHLNGHVMLLYLREAQSTALNPNCLCVPSFCHHDLGAHSLKNQILSLTLNVSTTAVIIYTPTLTLDAKPLIVDAEVILAALPGKMKLP